MLQATLQLGALLLISLAIGWALVVAYTAWLLTHPPRRGYAYAVARSLPGDPGEAILDDGSRLTFKSWSFRTHDGLELPVWDVAGRDPDGPTIVLTHGWGDARPVMMQRLIALAPLASRILMWDMRGHGDAPGVCRLGDREPDDLAALLHASGCRRAVLYGFSLGAGVSIAAGLALASAVPLVIAEAPYRLAITPARNMLAIRGLPWKFTLPPALTLLRSIAGLAGLRDQRFDRSRLSARMNGAPRLLVIVGECDRISPPDDARDIARAAGDSNAECLVIPDAGHADIWSNPRHAQLAASSIAQALRALPREPLPEPAALDHGTTLGR